MNLDYTILQARRLMRPGSKSLEVAVVGTGGTGSWIVPHIVRLTRLAWETQSALREVRIDLWDPDTVEEKNIYRQNFSAAEIGWKKVHALAHRYGTHWGVEVRAFPKPFKSGGRYHVILGCVDNHRARQSIHDRYHGDRIGPVWIDCGNAADSGQVLVGNCLEMPEDAFPLGDVCVALPIPTVQHPKLLERDAGGEDNPFMEVLSCADQALHGNQGLMVNAKVAAEAADYFARLVVKRNLRKQATYFDLVSGATRSVYVTP